MRVYLVELKEKGKSMHQVHNSFPLKKSFKNTVKKTLIIQITSDEQTEFRKSYVHWGQLWPLVPLTVNGHAMNQ